MLAPPHKTGVGGFVDQETYSEVVAALNAIGCVDADERPMLTALTGGVSSEIWRADTRRGSVCVKRALPKLRVAADWHVPIERWQFEFEWLRVAGGIAPSSVPKLYGADAIRRIFAMEYLDPVAHPIWKEELRQGRANPAAAAKVASFLVRVHNHTAERTEIADLFRTDSIFDAIRAEPYLTATGRKHPDLADRMQALRATLFRNKRALVHGDVSPKNILLGPSGPVLLDAECAWYGDPTFDIAFCLNHFLLKCLWVPATAPAFLQCFDSFYRTYLGAACFERADVLEARAARLLPALFLARVDGKSPVEYITGETAKDRVRRVSRTLLCRRDPSLDDIRSAWAKELGVA
jgi:aminoglycoside phosphotransferase (APT) family kinase protein